MNNEIIDKKGFNLMSYKKYIDSQEEREKKLQEYEDRYKNKENLKTKINIIKDELIKKKESQIEQRIITLIEYFQNLSDFKQIELLEKLNLKT